MTTVMMSSEQFIQDLGKMVAKQCGHNKRVFFQQDCLANNTSDVITFVGHAGNNSYGIDGITPEKFVDAVIDRCGLGREKDAYGKPKHFPKIINLIGCEIGFITNGSSFIQKAAARFAERGFNNVDLRGLTNIGHESDKVAMRVRIDPEAGTFAVCPLTREDVKAEKKFLSEVEEAKKKITTINQTIATLENKAMQTNHKESINKLLDDIKQLEQQKNIISESGKKSLHNARQVVAKNEMFSTNHIDKYLATHKNCIFNSSIAAEELAIKTELIKMQTELAQLTANMHHAVNSGKIEKHQHEIINEKEQQIAHLKQSMAIPLANLELKKEAVFILDKAIHECQDDMDKKWHKKYGAELLSAKIKELTAFKERIVSQRGTGWITQAKAEISNETLLRNIAVEMIKTRIKELETVSKWDLVTPSSKKEIRAEKAWKLEQLLKTINNPSSDWRKAISDALNDKNLVSGILHRTKDMLVAIQEKIELSPLQSLHALLPGDQATMKK